ncbi:MAG: alpha/beta fold hydrolase [Dehalococcoidia bacterium]
MPLLGAPGERIGYTVYKHPNGAPPLFLLHGFTASNASFLTNIPALRERFTVVTVDLLGHGESDAPAASEPYAPGPAVERIVDLMDELDYEEVLLCGHSLGGALALRVALDYPDRVAGLVVINSNSAAGTPQWREQSQANLTNMAARLRAEGTSFLRDSRLYPARSQRLPAPAREALTRDFDRLTPEGVAGTAESLVVAVNAHERLGDLAVPTLVVVGDRDPDFVHNAPGLVARIRKADVEMVTLENAGHAANLEQPAAFETALFAFAERTGYLKPAAAPGRSKLKTYAIVGAAMVAGWAALVIVGLRVLGADDGQTQSSIPRTPVSNVAGTQATPTGTRANSPTAAAPTLVVVPQTPAPASPTVTPTPAITVGPTATPLAATPTPQFNQPTPTRPPATPTPEDTPTPAPTATPVPATPTAPPAVSISGPASANTGQSARFTAGFGTAAPTFTYEWASSGSGGTKRGIPTYDTAWSAPGCQTVSLTVFFADGSIKTASTRVAVGGATCS